MTARLMAITLFFSVFLGIGCAGEDSDSRLLGQWERLWQLQATVGSEVLVERWRINFYRGKAFKAIHDVTRDINDLENNPFVVEETREGTYKIDSRGNLILKGRWLEVAQEDLQTIADLEGRFYNFYQDSMLTFSGDKKAFFLGPQLRRLDTFPYPGSYRLLYFDEDSALLTRQYVTRLHDDQGNLLLDDEGNPEEEREEQLTVQVGSGGQCTGELHYVNTVNGLVDEGGGEFTSCEYEITQVEVTGINGSSTTAAKQLRLEYNVGGLSSNVEYYVGVGNHYLEYAPSQAETAVPNSVYLKVKNIDQLEDEG